MMEIAIAQSRPDVSEDQWIAWRWADRYLRAFIESYDAEQWRHIGMCADAIQLTAQDAAGVSAPKGKKFEAARNALMETLVNLRDLDKKILADAIWLGRMWEKVKPWLDTLTRTERIKLCLPGVIRRKWESYQNSISDKAVKKPIRNRRQALEKVTKALEDKIEEADMLKAALAKAEEERDALRQAIKSELSEIIEEIDPINDSTESMKKVLREKVKQPKFVEVIVHIIRLVWPSHSDQPPYASVQRPLLM